MNKLLNLIPKFQGCPVLVLGDIMVDKFVWGKVSRISPEAPVPVVEVTKETDTLGGAGNVALNIQSLGGKAFVISVIGEDVVGDQLKNNLSQNSIDTGGLVYDSSRPTIIKSRIIASHQQVVRVDKEIKGSFSGEVKNRILAKISEYIPKVKAVIISDYGKGVIDKETLKKAIALAKTNNIPVAVDPKIEHFQSYKGVTTITPNTNEAILGMKHREVYEDKDIFELGKKILKKLNSKSVLITRGERGMTLFEPGNKNN